MLLVIHLHRDMLEAITLKWKSVVLRVNLSSECGEEHESGIWVISGVPSVSMASEGLVCFQKSLVLFLSFDVLGELLHVGGLLSIIHMEFISLDVDDFLNVVRFLFDDLLIITESVENRLTLSIKIGIRNLLKEL